MDHYVILSKSNLDSFIAKIAKKIKVMAPVRQGVKNFVFQEVKSAADIALKYIPTIIPPKKYFFPKKETLIEYDIAVKKWEPVLEFTDCVLFGVHTCDLAGIQCLNMVFTDKPKDINYIVRKNKIAIIGLECNEYCDEQVSCAVMDNHLPNGGYDLFFTDLGDYFLVHINTLLGDELVDKTGLFSEAKKEHLQALEQLRERKRDIFKDEVKVSHNDLKPLFDKTMTSEVWNDLDRRCIACGNCTTVCPTCYCFDIEDEISLDFNSGERCRKWDSCQAESFAMVAGGENFRKKRGNRQRHRYMRKFSYPVDKYSRHFCTGCGRCTRACMAKINLKETINTLVETQNLH